MLTTIKKYNTKIPSITTINEIETSNVSISMDRFKSILL